MLLILRLNFRLGLVTYRVSGCSFDLQPMICFAHPQHWTLGYRFTLYSTGAWDLKQRPNDASIVEGNQRFITGKFNEILLIAKGGNCSIFLNGQLLHDGNDLSTNYSSNRIVVYGNIDKSTGNFDNFKFWNLVGLKY